jgi:hypothetical protein
MRIPKPNDNELEKYKFPVNPKQLTGLATKADLEKLDHDLYSSYVGIQRIPVFYQNLPVSAILLQILVNTSIPVSSRIFQYLQY